MIYFLVNNNYHFLDVLTHCKELSKYDKSLIQIPHTLDTLSYNENFKTVYTFYTPFKEWKNYFNFFKAKKIEKKITKELIINKEDILFLYTEYEVLNQYIIKKFKSVGARVNIIEDGGFPTYLTYSVHNDKLLPIKKTVKLFYLKYVLGYRYTGFLYFNNLVFPQIKEKYIDGVLLYLDVPIVRKIKKYILQSGQKKLALDETKAIFLNEKVYEYYCTKEDYEIILSDVLKNLSQNFNQVYFKFHPRESSENRSWQLKIVKSYKNVTVIDTDEPIENILQEYQPQYIFSYLSAALLNLKRVGATPIYVFHLYEKLFQNEVFKQMHMILDKLGYTFIDNYKNVSVSLDFGNSKNKTSIKDIIETQEDQ